MIANLLLASVILTQWKSNYYQCPDQTFLDKQLFQFTKGSSFGCLTSSGGFKETNGNNLVFSIQEEKRNKTMGQVAKLFMKKQKNKKGDK